MSEKSTELTSEEIVEPDEPVEEKKKETSLVVARDLLPETLLIIPLYDRPMFPKMMGPIIVEDSGIQKTILDRKSVV